LIFQGAPSSRRQIVTSSGLQSTVEQKGGGGLTLILNVQQNQALNRPMAALNCVLKSG